MMKKIYLDTTQANLCMSVYMKDTEVILAGTPVYSMLVNHKNNEYQRYAEEYDIHFIFDDNIPNIDFYTVPMIEIFATDSSGGYIGSLGQSVDLQEEIPICYIDSNKKCYLIAANGKEFLQNVQDWKKHLITCTSIEFFNSLEDAKETYEFFDRAKLEQELKNINSTRLENIPNCNFED